MSVYPATSMATQTSDAVSVSGGTVVGVSLSGCTLNACTGVPKPASSRAGTFILNGTTPVTISSASLVITDVIAMSLNTVGGTVGVQPHVATITAGQATIIGTASDTSTMNYVLIATA